MKYKFILFFVVSCLVVCEVYFLFTDYGKVYFYEVISTIVCAHYVNEIWLKDDEEDVN